MITIVNLAAFLTHVKVSNSKEKLKYICSLVFDITKKYLIMDTNWLLPSERVAINIQHRHDNEIHLV